jgi:hypothetical protein
MPLTLKSHPLADDDFDVLDGKRRLGRVYRQGDAEEPWRWIISTAIADPAPRGRANTRVKAIEAFVAAYNELATKK